MIQKTGSSYPISHVGGGTGSFAECESDEKCSANGDDRAFVEGALRYFFPKYFGLPKVVPPDARMVHVLAGSLVFLVFWVSLCFW